jgi:hypothetical protein
MFAQRSSQSSPCGFFDVRVAPSRADRAGALVRLAEQRPLPRPALAVSAHVAAGTATMGRIEEASRRSACDLPWQPRCRSLPPPGAGHPMREIVAKYVPAYP